MTLRVLAAMSGGVDSAVAAARAAEAGHDVTGVHLALSKNPQSYRTGARGCCTAEDSRDARRAADVIGIPFYVWDMAEEFDRDVVQDFVSEYAAGRTPNPCLRCNEKIKFEAVLDRAVALGFDAVCTGHHVRKAGGRLRRSVDADKDQSYVLGVLDRDQVAHAMFPLGDCTKDEVRAEAERRGLAVADKPDSHDICFIADGDTAGFLNTRLDGGPGPIKDESGEVLGTHQGAHTYTVGQRKGLNLGGAAERRYVLSIEPVDNTVTVGPRESLRVDEITAERPVWSGGAPFAEPTACTVQLRAHGEVYSCTAVQRDGELFLRLDEPATGVAAGQAAVLYDGDTVLGSGTIAATARSGEPVAAG
ncbi:tRNA 2-thiouridine(34) synthase MnmA [Streptomonospora arabica]|uniref:tRNA-specific 2-thiouridylase MnmA n=1 Tax=Streptomonospora arabica TaxID=412417 RepID=A0ABV9SM53_9ACTN